MSRPKLRRRLRQRLTVVAAGVVIMALSGCAATSAPHAVLVQPDAGVAGAERTPESGAVWMRGHYSYVGGEYVWIPGHWRH